MSIVAQLVAETYKKMISAILLLAAGQSKRFKNDNKLTKIFKDKPLINHAINSLIKSKVNKIIVVLGHQHKEVKKIIKKIKEYFYIVKIIKKAWLPQ